ncbi:hypothetical protein QCB44_03825 [Thiomicrorhabdus sp. zzn3]|uniref:hypothetical protein n=1 Tax=Thiomicrorhabdus sp. zzn3 TaxID=3039775 RepID=UPI002436DD7C|nr:hypothetical protein [Thiomicrorhabdus sp. zzn3]MDG6777832.1 hypothetical protein [Thiomicrorhabdus sp. zzn3]
MAILIEGYSVVINKSLAMQNADALSALKSVDETLHPLAICSDETLLRVGFLDLKQAQEFLNELEKAGVKVPNKEGEASNVEAVMVTQFGEIETPCSWLGVQFTKLKDHTLICLGSLKEGGNVAPVKGVAFPKGWDKERSILKRYHDERIHYMHEHYDFVRSEPMHDIFRHRETQREVRLLKLNYVEPDQAQLQ